MPPENETGVPAKLPYPSSTGEVKLGATDFKELAEKTNTFLKEHTLIIKARAASYNAESGELAEQSSSGKTTTLPLATTANQIIGVICTAAECKITTSGGASIVGDFTVKSTVTLTEHQHLIVQSDGTNWIILSGEPKRENKWTAQVEKLKETAYTVSETRPSTVALQFEGLGAGVAITLIVGPAGEETQIAAWKLAAETPYVSWIFPVNPSHAWKVVTSGTPTIKESHLIG